MDFVRYLAFLSQYALQGSTSIARGYKSALEEYYELYIRNVVGESNPQWFKPFEDIFEDADYRTRFQELTSTLTLLEVQEEFTSIIEMDTYMFGLIYTIIFENKKIDVRNKDNIRNEINQEIIRFKDDEKHKRAPNALKYLKARIDTSIEIYQNYTND